MRGVAASGYSRLTMDVGPVLFRSLSFRNRSGTVQDPFEKAEILERFENGFGTVPERFWNGSGMASKQFQIGFGPNSRGQDLPLWPALSYG